MKTESAHILDPLRVSAGGTEGYHNPGLGGGLHERLDSHVTFLERSGGSLEGTTKTTRMMVPSCGMVLHGRIEDWCVQQQLRLPGS